LVVHRVKHPEELDYVREHGILIHRLDEIVEDLLAGTHVLSAAAGASLIELVGLRSRR